MRGLDDSFMIQRDIRKLCVELCIKLIFNVLLLPKDCLLEMMS